MNPFNTLFFLFSASLLFMSADAVCQGNPVTGDEPVIRSKISFADIEEYDRLYPELRPNGRRIRNFLQPYTQFPVDPAEIVYQAPKLENIGEGGSKDPSPLPEIDFQGLDDNGNSIPPDVNGAAGPDHLMVTLNTQVRIMDKEGTPLATVGTGAFWQGIPGAGGVFDPKISYDPYENRWIFVMPSSSDPAATRLMVAVSETSDPTGNWFRYSFDADPTDEYWFDYPDFGFNKKWIVVTGNMSQSLPHHNAVFIFNKEDLYGFAWDVGLTRIEVFDGLSLIPAVTMDDDEEDLYIVNHAGGNVGGYGYLKLRKVTGDVDNPELVDIGLSGVPYPWNEWSYFGNGDFAPQLGSDEKINTVDARFENMVFRNNKLWCVHHIYLPADDPTRSAVQWWELDTEGTILQWGREDGETEGMFYAFASIAVNAKEDVMIGYASFSEEQYASASYSFRYAGDPVNTLRERYQYKDGLAPYYKTFGGNRNRWGDYTATCIDPVNDLDFWTLQEYAELPEGSQDEWGVWWAKVNVEAKPEAHFLSNITEVPVGSGVNFFDASKYEPAEWQWIFEGGTPPTSTGQNPQNIVYEEAGLYDVTLIAINSQGSDTITVEDFINANTTILPDVDFSVSDTIPCLGDTVVLEDLTIYNPNSWFWEFIPNNVTFVNGTDENSQNPQVTFDLPLPFSVSLTAVNNNGSATLSKSALVHSGGQSLPFTEDFESFSFGKMGWTIENPDESKTWEITQVGGNEPGGLAAYVNLKSYNGLGERDRLISPPMNFYNHENIILSFQYAYSKRYQQYTDSLIVYVSPDCGASWERIIALGDDGTGNFATAGPMLNEFIPEGPEDWCGYDDNPECISADLPSWSGQSNVRFMFEVYNGFGNNLFIDNLMIDGDLVGVTDQPLHEDNVLIYPNPATGFFMVKYPPGTGAATLQVFDATGREVVVMELQAGETAEVLVDLSSGSNGIYFVKLADARWSVVKKLIVK